MVPKISSKILLATFFIVFSVILVTLLFLPKISPFESNASVYVLLDLRVQLYMSLLLLIALLTMLINTKTTSLALILVLFIFAYIPEYLVISGFDDHAFSGATSVSAQIINYGSTKLVSSVFINWPVPFVLNSMLSIVTNNDVVLSAFLIKTLYLLLTILFCYTTAVKRDLTCTTGNFDNIIERIFFIAPLALLYQFKFYQLTTASFLPLFTILIYFLLFREYRSFSDYFIIIIITSILPLSHGFSTLSLMALLIYVLLVLLLHEKSLTAIALVGLVSASISIVYTYSPWLFKEGFRAIKTIFELWSREDVLILNPEYSESVYSKTYRLTLELLAIPILIIIAIGVFSELRNQKFRQRVFLPLVLVFLPAVFMIYSIETIPRLVILSIALLTKIFVYGYMKLYYISRRAIRYLTPILAIIAIFMVAVAILGQPFRYVANDGVSYFLKEFYTPLSYEIQGSNSIMNFRIKYFINQLFYYEEKSLQLQSILINNIESYNLIYNSVYSKRWNIPTLIFYLSGK